MDRDGGRGLDVLYICPCSCINVIEKKNQSFLLCSDERVMLTYGIVCCNYSHITIIYSVYNISPLVWDAPCYDWSNLCTCRVVQYLSSLVWEIQHAQRVATTYTQVHHGLENKGVQNPYRYQLLADAVHLPVPRAHKSYSLLFCHLQSNQPSSHT